MLTSVGELGPMTDSEFRMFCELFRNHCGLHFGPESRFLLEKRLARRMVEIEVESFAAYHYLLRSEGDGARDTDLAEHHLTRTRSSEMRASTKATATRPAK